MNIFSANIIPSNLNCIRGFLPQLSVFQTELLSGLTVSGDILYPHRNQLPPLGVKHHLLVAHVIDSQQELANIQTVFGHVN